MQNAVVVNQTEPKLKILPETMGNILRIIPLGGLGEIGKNLQVYEFKRDILIVDCGLMFPSEEMLGIDFVIPEIRYLIEKKDKIRGIILTHGHLDHFGGLPYIWPKLGCPIYGAPLSIAYVKEKFQEFGISTQNLHTVKSTDKLQLGCFNIELFPMSHTMPDEVGLAIQTPVGLVLHIADFRIEEENEERKNFFAQLHRFANRGVLALLLDSTNAEVTGKSLTEKAVSITIEEIFKETKGRIIVTSFATNLIRVQSVIDAAAKTNRKVIISGFSMEKSIEIAMKLGILKIPKGIIVDIKKLHYLRDWEIAVLCTGSQGEEFSALSRMAAGEHKQVEIQPGDTVVVSASAIPGNERAIASTINNLFREGAEVIYGGAEAEIHASGHASAEDLKSVIRAVRPKFFIPLHGEYRHLILHAKLAQKAGVPANQIFVAENGQVVEVTKDWAMLTRHRVPSGYVLVDGLGVGDVGNIVLRDRQAMAKDGILVAIMTVDAKTGQLLTSPDIISRGFIYMREREDLVHKTRENIKKLLAKYNERHRANWALIKTLIREDLGDFLYRETERRPMILPVIIEV